MTARRHQIVALSAAVLFLAATTTAAIATPNPKVAICHATASTTNPYTGLALIHTATKGQRR